MNLLQCSVLLTSNFSNDPLFEYSFRGTETQRHRGMEAYFSAALDYCLIAGELVLAPGNAGLLGWIPGSHFPPEIDSFKMIGQPGYVLEGWKRLHEHEATPEKLITQLSDNQHFAYIWLLAVDFSVRGRGYGKWLLDAASEQAREAKLTSLWLSTENPDNGKFYEKQGFVLKASEVAASGLPTFIYAKMI